MPSVQRANAVVDTAGPVYALSQCVPSIRGKIADSKGVKRPLEEATAEGDKITAAATQKLASNAPVTDSDIDALLPDEGFQVLTKPNKDAQPES